MMDIKHPQEIYYEETKCPPVDFEMEKYCTDYVKWLENQNQMLKKGLKLELNNYTISPSPHRPETHVWIERDDGEGSEFEIKHFSQAVDEYCKKYF